jgi:ATP-dependent helicase/nuclease subunit B
MSLAEFLAELALALEETLLQEGPASSDAVRIMEVHEARGVQAPVVFVVGLTEGLFPAAATVRPFYGEREREGLNALGLGLEQQEDAECREIFLFYTAVTRATKRLYLTYPATDSRGRTQLRSHFVDEVEDVLLEPATCRQQVKLSDWPPTLEEVACPEELLERWTTDASQRPGRLGVGLVAACALLAEENPRGLGAVCDGAVQIRHREGADSLDSYDGVLGGARSKPLLAEEFSAGRLYSASQFDQYARCPFAFYLAYLLGVQPPPPPLERVEPVEIGALCHRALAQVYRRCAQAGKPPREHPQYARHVLEEVLARLFGEEPRSRFAIGRALADLYRSETLELLTPVLGLGPDGDFVPRYFEVAFGEMEAHDVDPASRREPLALSIGRESVLVRGRIDRVDVRPDSFVILDYKLGDIPGAAALRQGTHVQLALYLAAAENVLFPGRQCEAAGFVSLSQAKARFPIRREPANQAVRVDEARQLASQYVGVYVHAMRRGLFPPLPLNDRACSTCAFAPCCRREHARVERKAGPGGRAALLGLPAAKQEDGRP